MITTVSRTLAQQIVNTVRDICGHDINFINRRNNICQHERERIGTFHEIGKRPQIP
ncbi:MAG: sugar diacid recognition domain-containing protein [[Clostridium] scindens]